MCRKPVLDKPACDCKTALNQKLPSTKTREETMNIDRRELMLPALAVGLLGLIPGSTVPAFAGADEDTVAKNLEAFRAAQAVGNAEVLASVCAEELSYSHSSGAVDDKASLMAGGRQTDYQMKSPGYQK